MPHAAQTRRCGSCSRVTPHRPSSKASEPVFPTGRARRNTLKTLQPLEPPVTRRNFHPIHWHLLPGVVMPRRKPFLGPILSASCGQGPSRPCLHQHAPEPPAGATHSQPSEPLAARRPGVCHADKCNAVGGAGCGSSEQCPAHFPPPRAHESSSRDGPRPVLQEPE